MGCRHQGAARTLGAGQRLKPFTFRPKVIHAPAIETVAAEFVRLFPAETAPTINDVIAGLFFLHAQEPELAPERVESSSVQSTAPFATEPLVGQGPDVGQDSDPQVLESPKAVSVASRCEVVQEECRRDAGGRRSRILPVLTLVSLIFSGAAAIGSGAAIVWAMAALEQVNQLEKRRGRAERDAGTERLRFDREKQGLVAASVSQGASIQQLETKIQSMLVEIQALKNQADSLSRRPRASP
jgi:hypothetical protein